MVEEVIKYLEDLGYKVSNKPYEIINICDSWYMNEEIEGFHKRKTVQGTEYKIEKTNIAKRCCSDDANLCEVLNIKAETDKASELINAVMIDNDFNVMFRNQLEQLSATGTVGAYLRIVGADRLDNGDVVGGEIEINYVKTKQIYPISVKNEKIIECAFAGQEKGRPVIVIFSIDNGIYKAITQYFNKDWKKEEKIEVNYPIGCKPFSILKTAGVNNIEDMVGFGVPKIYNAISYLKGVDLAWNTFMRDLEKSDKLVLMNEKMLKFDNKGKPIPPSKSAKELFCFIGEKLPDEKSLIQEYNPIIRVDEITKAMEFSLSMLSNMFGYGTRKYSFENGQIKTATEYIGERQDLMQELNKQRASVENYIRELAKGILYLYKATYGFNIDPNQAIVIDFDDSYINDRESQLKAIQEDIQLLGLVEIQVKYLSMKYKITEEEARSWIENKSPEDFDNIEV